MSWDGLFLPSFFSQVNTKKDTEGLLKSYEKQQRDPEHSISPDCVHLCASGWEWGPFWWTPLAFIYILNSLQSSFLGAVNLKCKTKVEKMKWSWFFWGPSPSGPGKAVTHSFPGSSGLLEGFLSHSVPGSCLARLPGSLPSPPHDWHWSRMSIILWTRFAVY